MSAAGTKLAIARWVRTASLVVLPLLAVLGIVPPASAAPPSPELDPLWQVELHAGYGLAVSGSGTQMSKRPTPLTLSAIVGFAFNAEPPLFGFGGLVVETLDRSAVGGVFGIKYAPRDSRLHLAAGGTLLVAPESLLGASASGGLCRRQTASLGLCGDVQLTAYFAGSDLAEGRPVTQIQLVLGAVFDVR